LIGKLGQRRDERNLTQRRLRNRGIYYNNNLKCNWKIMMNWFCLENLGQNKILFNFLLRFYSFFLEILAKNFWRNTPSEVRSVELYHSDADVNFSILCGVLRGDKSVNINVWFFSDIYKFWERIVLYACEELYGSWLWSLIFIFLSCIISFSENNIIIQSNSVMNL